jgi:hypothetical protein
LLQTRVIGSSGTSEADGELYERVGVGLWHDMRPGDAGNSGARFWDGVGANGGVVSRFTFLGTTASL